MYNTYSRFRSVLLLLLFVISTLHSEEPRVTVGADRLFTTSFRLLIEKKRIGLVTNHTAVLKSLEKSCDLFIREHEKKTIQLVSLFAPEHGLFGDMYAGEKIPATKYRGIQVHSLHGATRRPTKEMLQGIDLLIYDIQDIGSRSYTFATTLLYCMEEAAKAKIKVIVLDRPNPMGGLLIDGPMLEEPFRSFVGYINVPYCHGMTIGELARFFNSEYKVGANLTVIPMTGWKRSMQFLDTGLAWIPLSPNIPEPTTALFYPATGILGEMGLVSIGIGYTLPFKVVTAPFIQSKQFVQELNRTSLKGIGFQEISIKPYSGKFAGKRCNGALLTPIKGEPFSPIETGYWIIDVLKRLYPKEILAAISSKKNGMSLDMTYKVCGTKKIVDIIQKQKRPFFSLCKVHSAERKEFLEKRKRYLLPTYN